ncbi:hypothetical protein K469DRAFT_262089 [Zopfia rhizophila CBS 207.26]|uniref:Uncharacterized protein n=1 Tax=Zopfia rhizophila CBS 207.26 TaxID=1314779 RepID=A0A6A6DPE4_9PEZI|nr:hypothetical protein K469DRAFT_262089 [Zopfia rhizophila CBS 207.26]
MADASRVPLSHLLQARCTNCITLLAFILIYHTNTPYTTTDESQQPDEALPGQTDAVLSAVRRRPDRTWQAYRSGMHSSTQLLPHRIVRACDASSPSPAALRQIPQRSRRQRQCCPMTSPMSCGRELSTCSSMPESGRCLQDMRCHRDMETPRT